MKRLITCTTVAVLAIFGSFNASAQTNHVAKSTSRPVESTLAPGAIKFINLQFSQVLPIYAELSGAQLDTNRLAKLPPVLMSFENKESLTSSEAVKLLDKTFYDHGIVATHTDETHVVFTYRSAQKGK